MNTRRIMPTITVLALLVAAGALAADTTTPNQPDKTLIMDGSVVHDVGDLWNHVTNWGLIGSWPGRTSTFSDSPSGYWHGWHHLYSAGLWVGGVVLGEHLVTTGVEATEIMATEDPVDIIYATARGATGGTRYPWTGADDDGDGMEDEEILDGRDNDADGAVDEDFAAISDQHFSCVMYDNTSLAQQNYPDHTPLNLRVEQQTYQWADPGAVDFIGYDYTVTNLGVADIDNVHCGMYGDFDINDAADDQAGSWSGLVEASDGRFVPVTLAWMHDGANPALGGWMGWVMCGMTTDAVAGGPADPLAIRTFQHMRGNAAFAQGGDPTNDAERYQMLSATADYWDGNTFIPDDYRVLLSSEEVPVLAPGESLTFRMALVAGVDLDDLIANAGEAVMTALGENFDRDEDPGNGAEFHVPWLRPEDVPVPNVAGELRASNAGGGVVLEFELRHAEDLAAAIVRRAGPGVPTRRWDDVEALAAKHLQDDDPVGWPRTYDLVLHTARGTELVLATVVVPGPPEGGLALTASPNPFNPRLTVHFVLPRQAMARLDVHDVGGKLVRTLFVEERPGGPGQAVWNGRDVDGREVASGVYLVRLTADGMSTSQRVTLMR